MRYKPKRIVASIEARMGSSRLPGKIMMDIAGRPSLSRQLERLRHCQLVDSIVLATTTAVSDEPLVRWAESEGVACFRGSEEDVLARVVGAHRMMESDLIIEVTGDCPLLEPSLIDQGVALYQANKCDVVSNTWVPSYPQGADVQVFSREILEEVERSIDDPAVREHVSLHFYENPKYKVLHLVAPPELHNPNLRLQLDYPEDLEFIRTIYRHFEGLGNTDFRLYDILDFLKRHPEHLQLNEHCIEKPLR